MRYYRDTQPTHPVARFKRMSALYGYFCPRCRQTIWRDRDLDLYFCKETPGCEFSETREQYRDTLRDNKLTLERRNLIGRARLNAQSEARRQTTLMDRVDVVYYIRFRDAVKIGTSNFLRGRIAQLPFDEVLAIEPGSIAVESSRHAQFKRWRLPDHLEWFELSDEIFEHAAQVRVEVEGWRKESVFGNLLPPPWSRRDVFDWPHYPSRDRNGVG